ncbi:MAG: iron ABC transporter permease, partial [Treponema sp.]|nr:iron ABC transporter permease [Treponema sp.]
MKANETTVKDDPAKPIKPESSREMIVIGALGVLLVIAVLVSLMIGRFGLSPSVIFRVLAARLSGVGPDASLRQADNVFFIIRLPRIFLTLLVGASLSLSGA